MFKRHYKPRRSTSIVIVIFRLILSVVMFTILLGGVYSAYQHFSGLDPLKLDPQALFKNLIVARTPEQFTGILSTLKISPKILGKNENPAKPVSVAPSFRFLLVADSHSDNTNLKQAISQANEKFSDLKFIIGLGDYTEVGTVDELKVAKEILDNSSLRYFLIPGDHDLWDCRNKEQPPTDCFKEVFGPPYQSFTFEDYVFLLLDNSDNYVGFNASQSDWITKELEKAKGSKGIFVFVHTPLYHPSSDHVMGWVQKELKAQAGSLLYQLKEAEVAKIFSGDIHFFSEYREPNTQIPMVTVGAVTIERNPQAPRYGVVTVYEDGLTKVEDVEIK